MGKQDEIKEAIKGAKKGYAKGGRQAKARVTHADAVPVNLPVEWEPVSDEGMAAIRRLANDPNNTMDIICSFVANGGSIVNLCKTWDCGYAEVLNWIRRDDARSKQYEQAITDRSEWTIEQILRELKMIAMFDLRDIYDKNNRLKPIHEWPEHAAKAVEAVKVDEIVEDGTHMGETKQVKIWSKLKAIELLGKNLQIFIDRLDVSGSLKLEDLVGGSDNTD